MIGSILHSIYYRLGPATEAVSDGWVLMSQDRQTNDISNNNINNSTTTTTTTTTNNNDSNSNTTTTTNNDKKPSDSCRQAILCYPAFSVFSSTWGNPVVGGWG